MSRGSSVFGGADGSVAALTWHGAPIQTAVTAARMDANEAKASWGGGLQHTTDLRVHS